MGRRIVSRGEYARLETGRVFMGTLSVCLWCFTAVTALAAFVSFIIGGMEFQEKLSGTPIGSDGGASWFLLTFIFAVFSVACGFTGRNAMKRSDKIDTGVPLTRANTADLPANDSLVRASQEPAQAQKGVLLRAASGEAQTGQEEQLLRASVGSEQA